MNKTAHAYAEGIFAPWPWLLWAQNGIITRRGALEQFLHTDAYQLPPPMSTIASLINVFICISDFDLDMGPTGFVPGSHLGPYMKWDGDEWSPRVPAVAKAGTAIIWEGRTWHGQCEHRSDKTRYSVAMSYSLGVPVGGELPRESPRQRLRNAVRRRIASRLPYGDGRHDGCVWSTPARRSARPRGRNWRLRPRDAPLSAGFAPLRS